MPPKRPRGNSTDNAADQEPQKLVHAQDSAVPNDTGRRNREYFPYDYKTTLTV